MTSVTEVWLHGNPICADKEKLEYFEDVRNVLVNMKILDGCEYGALIAPEPERTFLCDVSGVNLADQFLEYYYCLYDKKNRAALINAYHEDALFSLTSTCAKSQNSSFNK